MKTKNITKAWKSSLLASVLMVALGLGVYLDKVDTTALMFLFPVILALYPSDILGEAKKLLQDKD